MRKTLCRTLLLLPVITLLSFGCYQADVINDTSEIVKTISESIKMKQQKTKDSKIVEGDWKREDAPYQIKITEVRSGGRIKLGYFNPRSVNVGKASWMDTSGILKIYIELRDENYPGSNYTLTYLPEKDLLVGKYYQAVEKETFDVVFIREK